MLYVQEISQKKEGAYYDRENKKREKSDSVPAREDRNSENGQEKNKRRVAAYARVSTNKESQQTSYEAQVRYYTDYIKNRQTGALPGCMRKKA